MSKLIINTDGGARGNPGPAAVGVVIKTESGKILVKLSRKIGQTTNNVAEYTAVIEALKWLRENTNRQSFKEANKIQFLLDSTLVVNQLNGLFKVKDSQLKELFIEVRLLEGEVGGNIIYMVIPREKNWQADSLVNQALDS